MFFAWSHIAPVAALGWRVLRGQFLLVSPVMPTVLTRYSDFVLGFQTLLLMLNSMNTLYW